MCIVMSNTSAINIRLYTCHSEWQEYTYRIWEKVFTSILQNQQYSFSLIDAEEIHKNDWQANTDLLILPGGADRIYHQQLKGKGNEAIKDYIAQGGKLLGICAGAYYCANDIEFLNGEEKIVEERELRFFNGTAKGPLLPYKYNTKDGAAVFDLFFPSLNQNIKAYYNGGCYFPTINASNITWLARYPQLQNQENIERWAIIRIQIGLGTVVLSGVHFEMDSSDSAGYPQFEKPLKEEEAALGAYYLVRMVLEKDLRLFDTTQEKDIVETI